MQLPAQLEGKLFQNVSGYLEKYFQGAISRLNNETPDLSPWPTASTSKLSVSFDSRDEFLSWLSHLAPGHEVKTPHQFVQHSVDDFQSEEGVALVAKAKTPLSAATKDATVLVFGMLQEELKLNPSDAFSVFCENVVRIFTRRPDRLFMHAFRIRGSILETWTFDRAGGYCGPVIDINEQPSLFHEVMISYLRMGRDDLGLSPLLHEEGDKTLVRFPDVDSDGTSSYVIDPVAIAMPDNLVGRGTVCFRGQAVTGLQEQVAIKFAWSSGMTQGEWELLNVARAKNVHGVIKMEGHREVTSIASLRKGLIIKEAYFLPEAEGKAKQTHAKSHLIEAPVFDDLVLECTITSPFGRHIDTFDFPSELLKALHDVVRALQSLYTNANIIHRDVSTRNIVIAPHSSGDPAVTAGLLIDLDCALDLTKCLSQNSLVGSDGLMAIGIMGGDDHTYRHDLESVFYVFLWIAICHDGATSNHIPDRSRLHAWMGTNWVEIFNRKRADMQPSVFTDWVEKEFKEPFIPYLPLAHRLHALLFPIRDGKLFFKTDIAASVTQQLYDEMSAAFEAASKSSHSGIEQASRAP